MIINLISGPRNISTALMYSFAQRGDCKVVDEPFYGFYLRSHPEINHPGKDEIISKMSIAEGKIREEIALLEKSYSFVFLKNMAHHQIGLNWKYLTSCRNVFLIRNPKQLIASFAQVISTPSLQDIGLKEEADLFDYVKQHGKYEPIVLDSNTLLNQPEVGLRRLCEEIQVPFDGHMLSWEKGPIHEDGVWAKYWYKNVHNSTGFIKQVTSDRILPDHCLTLYEQALPYYEKLNNYALKY